jgi:hypothetical protein
MYLDVRLDADSLEFRAVGEVFALDRDLEAHPVVKVISVGHSGASLCGFADERGAAVVFERLYQVLAGRYAAAINQNDQSSVKDRLAGSDGSAATDFSLLNESVLKF